MGRCAAMCERHSDELHRLGERLEVLSVAQQDAKQDANLQHLEILSAVVKAPPAPARIADLASKVQDMAARLPVLERRLLILSQQVSDSLRTANERSAILAKAFERLPSVVL